MDANPITGLQTVKIQSRPQGVGFAQVVVGFTLLR
jgi:hypothetical protein